VAATQAKITWKLTMNNMFKDIFAVTTRIGEACCCECGHKMDACSGPTRPEPGDITLCIECGSLNSFDENLKLTKPTDEQYFEAAASPELQKLRRAILYVHAHPDATPKDISHAVNGRLAALASLPAGESVDIPDPQR
jgi:hypothetical protein